MAQFAVLSDAEKNRYTELLKAYTEVAKGYTQLSAAGLILPIVFSRQLLAVDPKSPIAIDALILLTWACFLLAIGSGTLYQYLAVKYLAAHFWKEDWQQSGRLVRNPGYIFGVMLWAFYFGAVFFVVNVIGKFLGHH